MNARTHPLASLYRNTRCILVSIATGLTLLPLSANAKDSLPYWRVEFPKTNFAKRAIDIREIRTTGARRDVIPPIWNPTFVPVMKVKNIGDHEPIISLRIGKFARAYPLRILLWHEIVHDRIADMNLLITYCALNNSSVVFDRNLAGPKGSSAILFGNTGRLRHFDTIMYDRKTETWWQRYTGRALIGKHVGARLTPVPSRLEAFSQFRERNPKGLILIPNEPKARVYGSSPYIRMDTSKGVGLEKFKLPKGVQPYDRVIVVGTNAWSLKRLKSRRVISDAGVVLRWLPGQNSIHDTKVISFGRDVGNVTVQRYNPVLQSWQDAIYKVSFAYAFKAFLPNANLYYDTPQKWHD